MFLTKKARYAVMAMLEMAMKQNEIPIKLAEIAASQEIDLAFLEQIFAKLKRDGLVKATRGPGGGYRLTKDTHNISVADIIRSMEEGVKMTRCANMNVSDAKGCLNHGTSICATHNLWADLERNIYDYFESKSLFSLTNPKDLNKIYLDHNATTPMLPEVKSAMFELYQHPLNASSVHNNGRAANHYIEGARSNLKSMIGAGSNYKVVFTGSATESNNLALQSFIKNGYTPVVSVIEHSSVLDVAGQGLIPVNNHGVIDLEAFDKVLSNMPGHKIVSVMLANNETGVIQPLAEVQRLLRKHGGLLHTDASQCPGKIAIDIEKLGVDMMTISAHKFGGPIGAAALIYKKGIDLTPIMKGGGQEYRIRPGTHNVQAIHGFGVACAIEGKYRQIMEEKSLLRDYMEGNITKIYRDIVVFGQGMTRLPNTSSISMPYVTAEAQIIHFDMHGIAVSAGSACSSGTAKLPYVQMAMGYSEEVARTSIRVSLGTNNTKKEIDRFIDVWNVMYNRTAEDMIIQKAI